MSFEAFDIVAYLDEKGIEYVTEGKNVSAGWIGLQCPYCSDQSNHLGVCLDGKGFSCFRCGERCQARRRA